MRLAFLFVATAVALASLPQAMTAASAKDEANKDEVKCKATIKTGTRFKQRICKTREQWKEIELQNQRDAHDMINRPVIETRGD